MKYTVYILSSLKTRKSYVGFTDDLLRRLSEHNSGKSSFTKQFMSWKIVYTEEHEDYSIAKKRETYLKSSSGRRLVLKKLFNKKV